MIAEKLKESDLNNQLYEPTTGTCADTPELSPEEQGSDNEPSESEISTSNPSKRASLTPSTCKNFNYFAISTVWKHSVQLLIIMH